MGTAIRLVLWILKCPLLVFVLTVSFRFTVIVRWNDSELVGARDPRRLIFHNEIIMKTSGSGASADGNGVLICRFSGNDPFAGWRRPDGSGITLINNNNDFRQFRTSESPTRVQLARARDPLQDGTRNDGLWTCNADGQSHHVPLYSPENGAIVIDSLTLGDSPSFSGNSPRFTLNVTTSGGPPTAFMWRRNGVRVDIDSIHTISVQVNPSSDATGRMSSIYRGFLVVTAARPGVYTYETYNRATSPSVSRSITVEGGSITNLQVTQTEVNMVRLTWNPPPGPPANIMYHITIIGPRNINTTVTTTTYTIELGVGSYTFRVMFTSQHFPAFPATQHFVVRSAFAPTINLSPPTTTSVTVSWSQPMFSFTVLYYEVSVMRLTLCSEVVGIRGPRHQSSTERREFFEDLEEFVEYRANITAIFQSTLDVSSVTTVIDFTTLPTVPSRVPSNVIPTTSSRTISVSWDAIGCSHQNGPNFRYDVEFLRMNGGPTPIGTVNDVMFTVTGLQPFTNYTFRIRGVNDAGYGGYTNRQDIQTNGIAPSEVPDNVMVLTVTSKIVSMSWDAIDTRNQYGPNFRYEVDFQRMNGRPVPVGTVNNLTFFVEGLQPFTNYTFRVRGVNDAGNGNYTRVIDIQTLQDVPSEVPSNVTFNVTSRSVNVSWDPVNPRNENGPNFHYQVEFMRMNLARHIITTANNSQFIDGLQPFTNYTFRIRGVNDFGNGDYTYLTVIQTNGEAPSEVPGNVMVLTLTSITISVSWDAIDRRNQNGPNFRYDVEFLRMDGGPVPVGTVNNVMFTVMGLQPFTNYTFRIRGVNDAGNGNYTRIIMIQTFKDVFAEAPSEVPSNVIFNVTSRSVSVSWDPINSGNENSPNFHYQLEFIQIDLARATVITTVNNLQLIDGLQPFTNYTFRVRGVNDFGSGNYTSLTVIQTSEDVPGSVYSLDYQYFNSNLVLVTWNPPLEPNGIIVMYELFYHLNQNAVSKNISSYFYVIVASEANSRVSGIRVRAYTSVGPGPFAEATLMSAHSTSSMSPVAVTVGVVTFPLGVVCGAVGAVLVVYCALKWRGGRGKLDLNPAGGVYEDVKTGPLYEDVSSATAAAPHVTPGPQLELRENVAYGHVGTK